MLTIALIAVSIGIDNFAASVAIGLAGVDRRLRLRIATVFGGFEAGLPLLGLLAGRGLAHALGDSARIIGGGLLIATGAYGIVSDLRDDDDDRLGTVLAGPSTVRMLVLGAALSIDNLIVGFALGADHAPLLASIVTIGAVSIALSLAGLELGARLGERVERYAELIGGLVLVAVGIAILTRLL